VFFLVHVQRDLTEMLFLPPTNPPSELLSTAESDHDVVRRWGLDGCKEKRVNVVTKLSLRCFAA
jgi:hypothetical protein